MKLYKRTLIISILVFLICVLLSYAFKFTCMSQFEICSFLLDYMIGIACSSLVVIITTFLQFKNEQRTILNSLLSNIESFMFHCLCITISFDTDEFLKKDIWENYYKKTQKDIEKLSAEIMNLEWFSLNKKKITNALHVATFQIRLDMLADLKSKKDILIHIVSSQSFRELKDSTILLMRNDDYRKKDILETYRQIQNELEKLDDKK